jgi:hypothetical protein
LCLQQTSEKKEEKISMSENCMENCGELHEILHKEPFDFAGEIFSGFVN